VAAAPATRPLPGSTPDVVEPHGALVHQPVEEHDRVGDVGEADEIHSRVDP
jgi:hypothetical protein